MCDLIGQGKKNVNPVISSTLRPFSKSKGRFGEMSTDLNTVLLLYLLTTKQQFLFEFCSQLPRLQKTTSVVITPAAACSEMCTVIILLFAKDRQIVYEPTVKSKRKVRQTNVDNEE